MFSNMHVQNIPGSHLTRIAHRHDRDRWRDLIFIGAAVLVTSLAIGATTSKGIGEATAHQWSVIVVDAVTQVELR
jgi:hypothetical protein